MTVFYSSDWHWLLALCWWWWPFPEVASGHWSGYLVREELKCWPSCGQWSGYLVREKLRCWPSSGQWSGYLVTEKLKCWPSSGRWSSYLVTEKLKCIENTRIKLPTWLYSILSPTTADSDLLLIQLTDPLLILTHCWFWPTADSTYWPTADSDLLLIQLTNPLLILTYCWFS